MAQLVTARRTGGWGQALLWGTICGFIVVVLDVAVFTLYHLLAPKSLDLGPIVLISLALLFAVGILVGQATGRVGAGAVAGLVTGTVSTLVELIILVVLIVVGLASQRPQQSPASGTSSGEAGLGVIGLIFLGIILLVLAVAFLLVFRLIAGAALGALGALLGRALSPDSGEGPAYPGDPGSPPPGGDVPRPAAAYPSQYPYRPPSGAPLPGASPQWPAIPPAQQPIGWPRRPSLRARAVSWWTEQSAVRIGVITAFALAIVDVIILFLSPQILLLCAWIALWIPRFVPVNPYQVNAFQVELVLFLLISTALLLAAGLSAGYKAPTADSGVQAGLLAGVLAAGLAAPLDAVLALVSMVFSAFVPQPVLGVLGWDNWFEIVLTAFIFLVGFVLPLLVARAFVALVGSMLGGLAGTLIRRLAPDGGSPAGPSDGGMGDASPGGGDGPLPPGYAPESPAGSALPPPSAIPSHGMGPLPLATPLLQHTGPSWPAS